MKKVVLILFFSIQLLATQNTGWNADAYAQTSEQVQKTNTINELGSLLQLRSDDTLIDFGAGDGTTSMWLAQQVGYVILAEPDENMISISKQKLSSTKNVTFLQLPVEKCCVSQWATKATLFWVDHWFKNRTLAYTNIYNSLKKDGILYLATMVNGSPIVSSFETIAARDHWKQYYIGYQSPFAPATTQELKNVLERVGFELLHFEQRLTHDAYPTKEILETQMFSLPFFERVENIDERKQMVQEFLDYYILNHCTVNSDGSIDSADEIVVAVCKKK